MNTCRLPRRLTLSLLLFLLSAVMIIGTIPVSAAPAVYADQVDARAAVLLEAGTGKVLFEQNADEPLPPASVTKVMTLLLVMEAIDGGKIALSDQVTVSEHAASMGGSQIFLEPGECMSAEDLIKSVVVASANDAAVALAEHIAGSEASFVAMMNERAAALGMKNTHFENTNGLDDSVTGHLISARDIAIMSAELLKHEKILDYTTIWQDSIRDGAFVLSNTNRLIRFYNGANGLKTGSTSKAKFCISATAKRDGMQLICVIMGAPTRDIRNAEAKKLLDFGFANYGVYTYTPEAMGQVAVEGGVCGSVGTAAQPFSCVLEKGKISSVSLSTELPQKVSAPVKKGDRIGRIIFTLDDSVIGESGIYAADEVEKISFGDIILRIFAKFATIFPGYGLKK